MASGARSESKSSYSDRTSENSVSAVSAGEGPPPCVELFPEAVAVSSSLGADAVLDSDRLEGLQVNFLFSSPLLYRVDAFLCSTMAHCLLEQAAMNSFPRGKEEEGDKENTHWDARAEDLTEAGYS